MWITGIALERQTVHFLGKIQDGAPDIFDKNQTAKKQTEKQVGVLYEKLGQLQAEHGFFSKISVCKFENSESRWSIQKSPA